MTDGRIVRTLTAGLLLPGLLVMAAACTGGSPDPDDMPVRSTGAAAETESGPPGVVLTEEQAAHAKVQVEPVAAVHRRGQQRTFARVMSIDDLAAARQALVRVRTDEAAARALLNAATAEANRVEALYQDGSNASRRTAEAARAAAEQAKAQLDAAQAAVAAERSRAVQAWGTQLASGLESDSRAVADLLSLREVPILVAAPSDATASAPATILLVLPEGRVTARFIAPLPRTDTVLQRPGWLYAATPGRIALSAGLNVEAVLAVGEERTGVEIPRSAGVWWQGSLWVYVQRDGGRYDRVLLPDPAPTEAGWFVVSGPAPGDRVATTGAQVLLSEELRAHGVVADSD